MGILTEIFKQLFTKPSTNLFPVPAHPEETRPGLSVLETLDAVSRGAPVHPPVAIPRGFRGKIEYDRDACIGCGQCMKVCPSEAIGFLEDAGKVFFIMARCTFCGMCGNICPRDCIRMSAGVWDNLMATTDKFDPALVVYDSGPFGEVEPETESEREPVAEPDSETESAKAPTAGPEGQGVTGADR